MEPKAFEIYRHFKGNLYQIIALAEEEGTGKMLVVYQGLYAPFKIYARPLSEFLERLDRVKYPNAAQEYRFERMADTEAVGTLRGERNEERAAAVIPSERLPESRDVAVLEKLPDVTETAGGIDPNLLLFLDAREPEDKLDALFRIKSFLTPDMLTVIEMSQGMEPQEEWTMEERYKHIKNDIITKQKYEQKRI